MPLQIRDWGEAMMTSVGQAMAIFLAALPKVLAFVVLLVIGWLLASLLAKGVGALLRTVRFNDLAERSGFSSFVAGMGLDTDASGFIAIVAKWFVRLITLVVAFDALGLPAVSDVLRQLVLWLPNVAVALVVLVIGGLAANAFASVVRGTAERAELSSPSLLAGVARVSVWTFAILIAVEQIGIAPTIVNSLFMAIVGSAALALGIAFGLGGRDTAAEIVRDWYERTRQSRLQTAAEETARKMGERGAASQRH
jgi:hypothetical protein